MFRRACDGNLSWSFQIQHINNKLTKNLSILYKVLLSLELLKQLYYSLFYPYLQYGIMSWGNTYKTRSTKIKSKQNNCVRCVLFAHKRESSLPYFNLLEILNFDNIYKYKVSLLAHKLTNNSLDTPEALSELFLKVSDVHSYAIPGMHLI